MVRRTRNFYISNGLQAAKIVSGDYDKLTEFFQDVKSYLSGIQMWESQVPSAPQLKYAITTVFSSVLVLCGVYTRYINKKRVGTSLECLLRSTLAARTGSTRRYLAYSTP